jgi:glycosyltransferase involved in cell wall biosynthesis
VLSRLRVAQVICTDAFAGAERYVMTLATGLGRRVDCEVVVIGGQQSRMQPALAELGVTWVAGSGVTEALSQLLRQRPFDVVHAHMTKAELAAVLGTTAAHVPVVATRHFAQRRGSTPPARLLGRLLTPRLEAQLAISRFVADRIEGSSVLVPPGVEDVAETIQGASREPVVLVVQRLEAEKRTDLALDIWQQSGLAELGWRLEIAGDGHEREQLIARTEALGVRESCRFLGDQRDVAALYRRAAVLLAPRPDEPFGLSVVEAMAWGLPVVAAGGGGHLETVGAVDDAALFAPGDIRAAGRLLADLAADPDRRDRYGAALRAAQRACFSVDRQVSATLDLYHSLQRPAGRGELAAR